MNILITGASGFVGSQLVKRLSPQHQLCLLSRKPQSAAAKLGTKHRYISHLKDFTNLDAFDAVINLAGEPITQKRWSSKQKERICQSRWELTATLSALINAGEQPPKVFLSASAIGYYGRQSRQNIDERFEPSSRCQQEFTHQVCAQWEHEASQAAHSQTRVCILRIGLVLGAQGGALAKMLPPFKLGLGGRIADGEQGMSWIHQCDLIRLIAFLLDNPQCSGVYNACAPEPVSNRAFTQALASAVRRPAFIPIPALALKLALGEMSTLLNDGQYVVPFNALAAGFVFNYPNIDAALNEICQS